MSTGKTYLSLLAIVILLACAPDVYAEQKGKPVYGRNDPSKYFEHKKAHGGGSIFLMSLLPMEIFETNFLWMHRGIIPPKSGIGEHHQKGMEDMFIVFNAPAEFTVGGRTSLLPAGSTVICPITSSHGIYNNSDVALEWMNLAVSTEKGKFEVIDFADNLTNQEVESPAPFKWAQFDRSLLKPSRNAHEGKGTLYIRRLWEEDSFQTNWLRITHCVLPPGTSIGYHQHNIIEEIYCVMSGNGTITVNDYTWRVRPGDNVPCTLHDSHGLYNNTDDDLEIFIMGITTEKEGIDDVNWGDDLTGRQPQNEF